MRYEWSWSSCILSSRDMGRQGDYGKARVGPGGTRLAAGVRGQAWRQDGRLEASRVETERIGPYLE